MKTESFNLSLVTKVEYFFVSDLVEWRIRMYFGGVNDLSNIQVISYRDKRQADDAFNAISKHKGVLIIKGDQVTINL